MGGPDVHRASGRPRRVPQRRDGLWLGTPGCSDATDVAAHSKLSALSLNPALVSQLLHDPHQRRLNSGSIAPPSEQSCGLLSRFLLGDHACLRDEPRDGLGELNVGHMPDLALSALVALLRHAHEVCPLVGQAEGIAATDEGTRGHEPIEGTPDDRSALLGKHSAPGPDDPPRGQVLDDGRLLRDRLQDQPAKFPDRLPLGGVGGASHRKHRRHIGLGPARRRVEHEIVEVDDDW